MAGTPTENADFQFHEWWNISASDSQHLPKIVICGKCKTFSRNLKRSLEWTEGYLPYAFAFTRLSLFTHIVNVIKVPLLYRFPLVRPPESIFHFSFGDSHNNITTNIRFNDQRWILLILHASRYCYQKFSGMKVVGIPMNAVYSTSTISFVRQCREFRMCNGIIVHCKAYLFSLFNPSFAWFNANIQKRRPEKTRMDRKSEEQTRWGEIARET